MQLTVNTSERNKLDWAASGAQRIAQNINNLISTAKYEVAYDRTLGIDRSFLDKPLQEAIAVITAQIYDTVAQREPRATVESVNFISIDNDGNMNFEVVINIE